jgi:hypothetical protein
MRGGDWKPIVSDSLFGLEPQRFSHQEALRQQGNKILGRFAVDQSGRNYSIFILSLILIFILSAFLGEISVDGTGLVPLVVLLSEQRAE